MVVRSWKTVSLRGSKTSTIQCYGSILWHPVASSGTLYLIPAQLEFTHPWHSWTEHYNGYPQVKHTRNTYQNTDMPFWGQKTEESYIIHSAYTAWSMSTTLQYWSKYCAYGLSKAKESKTKFNCELGYLHSQPHCFDSELITVHHQAIKQPYFTNGLHCIADRYVLHTMYFHNQC